MKNIAHKIAATSKRKLSAYIIIISIIFLAGLAIFFNGQKIYVENVPQETEKIITQPEDLRKDYYKLEDKQITINDITLPIYVGKGSAPKTLLFDITIKSSNRFLIKYFYQNHHMLKDHLNSSFEPMTSDLPFTDEGKRIIKEKIIFELNELLKEKKVEGHIDDVYFHSILTG